MNLPEKSMLLLTPGPTQIPQEVLEALGKPVMHHRTPEFETLFASVQKDLRKVFQTEQPIILITGTGTTAMEAAFVNLFTREDKLLVINAGKFGERWTKIAKAYQVEVDEFFIGIGSPDLGEPLDLTKLEAFIQSKNKKPTALLFQASETSTGIQLPTKEITALAHKYGMLAVCDGITACGIFDLPMDQWGMDVVLSASQKAFMLPPGLAFVAYSKRAWEKAEQAKSHANALPKFSLDLFKERALQAENQTAWTPATQLIQALRTSLDLMLKNGLSKLFEKNQLMAEEIRLGVKNLGLELLAPKTASQAVTAVKVPPGIDASELIKTLKNEHAIVIAGGQDVLKGKIFRLSHFGSITTFDRVRALQALASALEKQGYRK